MHEKEKSEERTDCAMEECEKAAWHSLSFKAIYILYIQSRTGVKNSS